jgi:hypothetical protein
MDIIENVDSLWPGYTVLNFSYDFYNQICLRQISSDK